ncbi:TPA: site-specific DNA-methyltransferase [Legionella pneumophila]|nr:site-specific DNA-methyltransferase [Legionella pneumophila]HAT7753327.1 site-specific DNA-methyltransferase [Legionella pneumophila]HAU0673994.1 site-specific DNA-methyltransferase [Legionella pneumophila]HAU1933118.1 site-specific DNA-methyltransferase [Legionella pneumophila]HAU2209792.1 site-specific DNA-methyltransferase [Legionella pneumophila]
MDSLKMHSKDITEENIEKIAILFPNCISETKDEQGRLRKKIDFDLLRQELSREIVEGQQERYQLNWPGKRQALLTANAPIAKTLRPCLEESVDFEKTQNLFIEGDNLDALKLLQETYLEKVKMIYIDPPYNTGKNFIYSDNFFESVDEYLFDSQQVDGNGNQLVANMEAYGRFHSDWLTMMYSRLKLAKNLLTNDGIIFISIDDNEVHNLRKLCDEIFGEDNFMVNFSWRTDGNFDNQAKFKKCHEYILGYAKNEKFFSSPPVIDPNVPQNSKLYKSEVRNTIVKNGPKNPLSTIKLPIGFPSDLRDGKIAKRNDIWPHYISDAVIENGKLINEIEVKSGWSSKELLLSFISNDCQPIQDNKGQETRFVISLTGAIEVIKQRSSEQSHVVSSLQNFGGPQKATNEIKLLGVNFDDYPKPLSLMTYLCQMVRGENDIYLDFFAGSSTTAHAIMKLNAEDNANRKFIMVQLPEACDKKSEAYKDGFKTIADIGKERIRRAGKKIKEENADKGFENLDTGFRVLKVDSTNVTDVYYTTGTINQDLLTQYTDNIKSDRNPEDLLFQVLLDWGVDLTLPITKKNIQDYKVFFVDEDALIACFDNEGKITEEFVKELTQYNPLRVVFRDAGFASDSVKINVTQIFKQLSPHTEVKTI